MPDGGKAKNICFINVSVSRWTIDKRESSILRPEKLVDLNFRTPLHYATESGRLEAVKTGEVRIRHQCRCGGQGGPENRRFGTGEQLL